MLHFDVDRASATSMPRSRAGCPSRRSWTPTACRSSLPGSAC